MASFRVVRTRLCYIAPSGQQYVRAPEGRDAHRNAGGVDAGVCRQSAESNAMDGLPPQEQNGNRASQFCRCHCPDCPVPCSRFLPACPSPDKMAGCAGMEINHAHKHSAKPSRRVLRQGHASRDCGLGCAVPPRLRAFHWSPMWAKKAAKPQPPVKKSAYEMIFVSNCSEVDRIFLSPASKCA